MSEFDEKLSALLSSPENIEKIAQLAASLSNMPPQQEQAPPEEKKAQPTKESGLDIAQILRLFSSATGDDSTAALLKALKPFLSQERAEKVDAAMNAARLARVAQNALMKGKE